MSEPVELPPPGGCFRCGYGEPCGNCDLEYEASQDPAHPLHPTQEDSDPMDSQVGERCGACGADFSYGVPTPQAAREAHICPEGDPCPCGHAPQFCHRLNAKKWCPPFHSPSVEGDEGERWTIGDCECGNTVSSRRFDKPCPECGTFHYVKVEVVPAAERDEAIKEREEVWRINQDLASDAELLDAKRRAEAAEAERDELRARLERVEEAWEWAMNHLRYTAPEQYPIAAQEGFRRLDHALGSPTQQSQ